MAENEKVQVRLPPIMHAYLDDLVDTGLYGKDPTDVARSLIEEGIRRAVAQKLVNKRGVKSSQ